MGLGLGCYGVCVVDYGIRVRVRRRRARVRIRELGFIIGLLSVYHFRLWYTVLA